MTAFIPVFDTPAFTSAPVLVVGLILGLGSLWRARHPLP